MSEIKVSRWVCDTCQHIYDSKVESEKCIRKHKAEEAICNSVEMVTIGIARSGQSMMGGPISFEGYDWTAGQIVARRKGENGPEALIEIDGERNWVSGYMLIEWDRQKKEQECREAHPVDYSKMSHMVCVTTFAGVEK